jgi:hypothetical protein
MRTDPVNQSSGPLPDGASPLRVIFMLNLLSDPIREPRL